MAKEKELENKEIENKEKETNVDETAKLMEEIKALKAEVEAEKEALKAAKENLEADKAAVAKALEAQRTDIAISAKDKEADIQEAKRTAEILKKEMVKIKIPKDPLNPKDLIVPVMINGYTWKIKRGETVDVPVAVAEILESAKYI